MKLPFNYFSEYDISNFNPRNALKTSFKLEQSLKQINPCIKFLIDFVINQDFRNKK